MSTVSTISGNTLTCFSMPTGHRDLQDFMGKGTCYHTSKNHMSTGCYNVGIMTTAMVHFRTGQVTGTAPKHHRHNRPFSFCCLSRSASDWVGSSHTGPSQQKLGNGKLVILYQAA